MLEKIINLLFIFLFFYFKYIVKIYKKNIRNDNKNTLTLNYNFLPVSVVIKFLIPFYIFIILIGNNFWNDNSIDKVLTLILMTTFLMIMFFYVVFVLKYRIVMCEEKFIYVNFFKKRQVEYKELKIKYGVQNVYIYRNKHKILKLNLYVNNYLLLVRKIIEINGYECIIN